MLNFRIMAALAVLLSASITHAEPTVLKFATGYPSGALVDGFVRPWAEKIEEDSHGTVKIEIYTDGKLAKIGDTVDRVSAGIADIGWDNPQAMGLRFASLGVTSMPGLYDTAPNGAAAAWRAYENGTLATEFEKEAVTPLLFYAAPPYSYFLRERPKDLANFEGLTMAMSSKVRAALTEAAGGVPVAFGPPEYYQSLQRGVIDGVMTALIAVLDAQVDEILDFYLRGPFGGAATIFFINTEVYESLPEEARKAFDMNSGEAGSVWVGTVNQEYEEEQWKTRIGANSKNEVVRLEGADLEKWQAHFDKVSATWIEATPNGQEIYDGFKAAVAEVRKEQASN